MKVLDLQCSARHSFEGWFASEDDFQSQLARGLVECPLCADSRVVKIPSAPRLNLGSPAAAPGSDALAAVAGSEADAIAARAMQPGGGGGGGAGPRPQSLKIPQLAEEAEAHAGVLKALRHRVARTENVGDRFAQEARRMHYGEIAARSIRGQATQREAAELQDEGIEVMALPLPAALKETLQ